MDIRMGGTTRRNDAQDIEPVAYFDVDGFTAVGANEPHGRSA
jgi:hypothetical protein